ncbi:sensor histidine kinase [Spirochaeta dissipatitropha]
MNGEKALLDYMREESPSLIFELDHSGEILGCNAAAESMSHADPTGSNFREILLDFDSSFRITDMLEKGPERILCNLNQKGELPQTYYFRFIDCGKSILAIGEIDHNEIIDMRQNLVQMNNDFSNLNRDLQKKTAELQRTNQQKNRFLGMAAHDLRNPIASICSLSSFLIQGSGNQLQKNERDLLFLIQESGEFMLSLLEDLLSIAKIESGQLHLNTEQIDYTAELKRTIASNQILALKRDIKIYTDFETHLPELIIDKMKIRQVLNNLLSNAIKYSPDSTEIHVSAFNDGNFVITSIEDQGIGIDEEEIAQLFVPFHESKAKSFGEERSTGLGLSIVQRIVIGHGGRIWVDSTPDKGTVFFFSLPITQS